MRRTLCFVLLLGCGGGGPATGDAPSTADAPPARCQPIGATGSFYRRPTNPRLVAGHHTYGDGMIDVGITDPDLRWDDAAQRWQLYLHAPHATAFGAPTTDTIRHATSPDLATWTIDDAPSLVAASDASAWDHQHVDAPTVVENPDAPADRRYLLLYTGASGAFPFPGYGLADTAIGAAFSADGTTFTRVPAADSPHGQDGLVLTGLDAYPGVTGGIVADPEVVLVGGTYHLWFSSFSCTGATCETVNANGIAHATSTDGIHWTVDAAPVKTLLRASADPKTGGAQPTVIYDDVHCRFELWLTSDQPGDTDAQPVVADNMAGVWHATSMDGLTWNISYTGPRDLAWTSTESGEHLGLRTGADVAIRGGGRYLLYGAFDDQDVPSGFTLPDRSTQGTEPGVMTLDLATRDAP